MIHKIKYLLLFLLGNLFFAGMFYGIYYLGYVAGYKIIAFILLILIAGSSLKTFTTLPYEIIGLIKVFTSKKPKRMMERISYLRERRLLKEINKLKDVDDYE